MNVQKTTDQLPDALEASVTDWPLAQARINGRRGRRRKEPSRVAMWVTGCIIFALSTWGFLDLASLVARPAGHYLYEIYRSLAPTKLPAAGIPL